MQSIDLLTPLGRKLIKEILQESPNPQHDDDTSLIARLTARKEEIGRGGLEGMAKLLQTRENWK